jgi:epoxide hydrolase
MVPVGVAVCPHDRVLPVRAIAEWMLPIVRWTEFDRGGHFAALEVPGRFTADVRAFFRALRYARPRVTKRHNRRAAWRPVSGRSR